MPQATHSPQAKAARVAILSEGGRLMKMPIDLQQALYDDPNVYDLTISCDWPGPHVRLRVNGWDCDYWPALTYERALEYAEAVAG